MDIQIQPQGNGGAVKSAAKIGAGSRNPDRNSLRHDDTRNYIRKGLPQLSGAAPGDGGNKENLVTIVKSILAAAQEADIFVIYVDVHKTMRLSLGSAEVLLDAGKFLLQRVKKLG
jgi:hypothetical protein